MVVWAQNMGIYNTLYNYEHVTFEHGGLTRQQTWGKKWWWGDEGELTNNIWKYCIMGYLADLSCKNTKLGLW